MVLTRGLGTTMQYNSEFQVTYLTPEPTLVKDVIASLQGVETTLNEVGRILPLLLPGLTIEKVDIRIREITQNSPLKEAFGAVLLVAFQKDLEREVPDLISTVTGLPIPERLDATVTVLALIIVFYGIGAMRDLVFGTGKDSQSSKMLDELIAELSVTMGVSALAIRKTLEERYSEKTMWRRLANATSRFFTPSKRQDSAPVEINGRHLDQDLIREIPESFRVEDALDEPVIRDFTNATLDLHAQDKDHAGRGWAAIVAGVSDQRARLKLMAGVPADRLWGHDRITGDITVIFERLGMDLLPKEIHLHRIERLD